MNSTQTSRISVLVGFAMLASTVALYDVAPAYGQAYVEPESQPFLTLAPYVLESSNLEPRPGTPEGGTLAYRPWFESGAWTGDLIQYEIDKDGRRSFPGGTVGLYPRDGEGWNTYGNRWAARYVFPDFLPYDADNETSGSWNCEIANTDAKYWENRNIYTVVNGQKQAFWWNNLSNPQRVAIDSLQAAATGNQRRDSSSILNFIRGDRTQEACMKTRPNMLTYRMRFSILGAIVNSRPVHVPSTGDGLVVVGANDGMLHAFNAATGQEAWAYVPSMLLGKVSSLRLSPYRPTYFVDGELRHANIGTTLQPRHIVTGGLGAGARGMFILDVTNSSDFSVSGEFAGTPEDDTNALPFVGGTSHTELGYVHGRPTIAKIPDGNMEGGRWYVISGNGYASNSGTAQLVLIPLNSDGSAGAPVFWSTAESGNNGLSAPALVDSTGDGLADLAYAGDLKGNLWRFDLSGYPNRPDPVRLFVTDVDASNVVTGKKPITVQPDVALHPEAESGYMVYFGTGSLLSNADARNRQRQSVFGIWDRGRTFGDTIYPEDLITQRLVSTTLTWSIPEVGNACPVEEGTTVGGTNTASIRFVEDTGIRPQWLKTDPAQLGWRVDLPRDGERVIGHPQVRAERIQFITTNPVDMLSKEEAADPEAGSWMLQLDLASGALARSRRPLFDLNKNCSLDTSDGSPITLTVDGVTVEEGAYPVGLNIGPFNVAQPAFARVSFNTDIGATVDGVYINALDMPHPEFIDDVLHGPLDVMTDSPRGPAHKVVRYEPRRAFFTKDRESAQASGPTKPFLAADGLGHRVDGHSFAYNRHHGVNSVDLFELEPQRGGPDGEWDGEWLDHGYRLDIGATYWDGTEFKLIPAKTPSEQELNRVTEVGMDEDQEFIIVVANADLSRENTITIGCNSWPVYQYQTRVMNLLRIENEAERIKAFRDAGLVFSLTEGPNAIRPSDTNCPNGLKPTIRITPTMRIGIMDATMHTLPGCVNNTDLYAGPSGSITQTRKDALTEGGEFVDGSGPEDLYLVDPHTTQAFGDPGDWQGYRWRNGALTLQLLAVGPGDTQKFELQPNEHLPKGAGIEGEDAGWGGAYAKAFKFEMVDGVNSMRPLADADFAFPASGMLYEINLFWHWGDMADFQTPGQAAAVNPVCLGAAGHKPRVMFEGEWFTGGDYGQLTDGLEDNQWKYIDFLRDIKTGDEDALQNLYDLFDTNDGFIDYHRLRHYVENSKNLNRNRLLAIDSGNLNFESGIDGTPIKVEEIEADLLPSLGPNYRPGRRSWIDITPE